MLGTPGECFNPAHIPGTARAFGVATLPDYVDALRRRRNTAGRFGFEATWFHLLQSFASVGQFHRLVHPDVWIWLIREDIVAQGVSLSRMVQTRVAHSATATPDQIAASEAAFGYDAAQIGSLITRIRQMEAGTERMLAQRGIAPLRVTYEALAALPPPGVADVIAGALGVTLPEGIGYRPTHERLATAKNASYAARFRAERAGFLEKIDRARAPLLAAHRG